MVALAQMLPYRIALVLALWECVAQDITVLRT